MRPSVGSNRHASSERHGTKDPTAVRAEPRPAASPSHYYRELSRVDLDAAACYRTPHTLRTRGRKRIIPRRAGLPLCCAAGCSTGFVPANSPFIGITSPGPGEGKSLTAVNLAISIVREKQHPVFLLDLGHAQSQHPEVHGSPASDADFAVSGRGDRAGESAVRHQYRHARDCGQP